MLIIRNVQRSITTRCFQTCDARLCPSLLRSRAGRGGDRRGYGGLCQFRHPREMWEQSRGPRDDDRRRAKPRGRRRSWTRTCRRRRQWTRWWRRVVYDARGDQLDDITQNNLPRSLLVTEKGIFPAQGIDCAPSRTSQGIDVNMCTVDLALPRDAVVKDTRCCRGTRGSTAGL